MRDKEADERHFICEKHYLNVIMFILFMSFVSFSGTLFDVSTTEIVLLSVWDWL